jgi:hypothetical protein
LPGWTGTHGRVWASWVGFVHNILAQQEPFSIPLQPYLRRPHKAPARSNGAATAKVKMTACTAAGEPGRPPPLDPLVAPPLLRRLTISPEVTTVAAISAEKRSRSGSRRRPPSTPASLQRRTASRRPLRKPEDHRDVAFILG